MAAQSTDGPQSARKWIAVRAGIAVILIGAVLTCLSVYNRYTDPERVRAAVETYLQQFVTGPVKVKSAEFSWISGIRLHDVAVHCSAPGVYADSHGETIGAEEPVFSCREVRLTIDRIAATLGRPAFKSILAVEPVCSIVRDAHCGATNLSGLLRPGDRPLVGAGGKLPTVEIRDAHVRVMQRSGGALELIEELPLNVRGRTADGDARYYDLAWQSAGALEAGGLAQVDTQTGFMRNVRGGLPPTSIGALLLAFGGEQDGVCSWEDRFGLQGRVYVRDYSFAEGPKSYAQIELSEASFSIPITAQERSLASDDRYVGFKQVQGTVSLTPQGVIMELDALFNGASCRASAQVRGDVSRLASLDEVGFEAEFSIQDLTLPEWGAGAPLQQRRFVERWRPLENFYRDYDPHGPADLRITLQKSAGPTESAAIEKLVVEPKGCDASCRFFPYPLSNVAGKVEWSPSGVVLRDIRGEHGGGLVTVNGRLSAPKRNSAVKLAISAVNLPIDGALYEAVSEKYRRIHDMFQPAGRLNVEVQLSRPESADETAAAWQSRVALGFDALEASYTGFPYPLKDVSGLVVVEGGRAEVMELKGTAAHGEFLAEGTADLRRDGPENVDVRISGTGIIVDETLVGCLPSAARGLLDQMRISGRIGFDLALQSGPAGEKLAHALDISLDGVTCLHDSFPVRVHDVRGNVYASGDVISFRGVSGRYEGAEVSLEGQIDPTVTPAPIDVSIQCRGLRLDQPLRSAARGKLRSVVEEWRVDGPIDVDISLNSYSTKDRLVKSRRAEAVLTDATVKHALFPVPFEHVHGRITFDDAGCRADGIDARYGAAKVSLNFASTDSAAGEEAEIGLTAVGVVLDESIRATLPNELREAWDRIGLGGIVDVRFDRLRRRRPGAGRPAEWSVEGRLDLHGVALPGAVGLESVSGTVEGQGLLIDRLSGVNLSGTMALDSADVFSHRLETINAPWSYARTRGLEGKLDIGPFDAHAHGGRLNGNAELFFDRAHTDYDLNATVRNMDIQSYLTANGGRAGGGSDNEDVRGIADARLSMAGRVGNASTRRGGGRVEIRDGHMYRLPILLAIFNVINLTVPDDDAFQTAQVDFHVAGNRVLLEEVLLRGSALALSGYGSLSLPDLGVDLFLVNVSPHGWARLSGLGNLVERATREIVELHVTGPLSQPTVRAVPIRGVTEEMKRLFKKKESKSRITAGS